MLHKTIASHVVRLGQKQLRRRASSTTSTRPSSKLIEYKVPVRAGESDQSAHQVININVVQVE